MSGIVLESHEKHIVHSVIHSRDGDTRQVVRLAVRGHIGEEVERNVLTVTSGPEVLRR